MIVIGVKIAGTNTDRIDRDPETAPIGGKMGCKATAEASALEYISIDNPALCG